MHYSLYPTDEPGVRDAVAEAAATAESPVFTSLHMPESVGLRAFGGYLRDQHRERGLSYCADISPATLGLLDLEPDEVGRLRDWGVTMVRIDYGFTPAEVARIARAGGFRIAVNASTVTADELAELDGLDVVGWHNYYPRPETGLSWAFFVAQNELLSRHGLEIYAFIPGELSFRAPLGRGLPTLESHRYGNAYLNHARLLAACPQARVVCAEGTLLDDHVRWIAHREATGEITLPMAGLDASVAFLRDASWRLRVEGTDSSHRIDGTRRPRTPARVVNGDRRRAGSLQVDLPGMGRYHGELHLMHTDRPLSAHQARVGEIAAPYLGLVDCLRPGDRVRFD